MNTHPTDSMFKSTVLGEPSGLYVLFFTEMWERFSYYGMRALLILFFTAAIGDGGWGWPQQHAMAIFGTYVSLVYLSTLLGGWFADNKIGYRNSVALGALLMTLGHASMGFETQPMTFLGLTLLIFGTGFFKPSITSIISQMYEKHPEKKDGAYTIFYMGVNAGAFLGILLCGYLGETFGWSWGFGVAGIFMLFGLLQFWFTQGIFETIGLKPEKKETAKVVEENEPKLNPFTSFDKVLMITSGLLGFLWIINDPINVISEGAYNIYNFELFGQSGSSVAAILGVILFIILVVSRIVRYDMVTRDRMIAVSFFAFITIFFWAIFEQAPTSLTIFSRDYTARVLEGNSALIFNIINSLITIVPLAIITWVLFLLFRQTFEKYRLGNIFLSISFLIIWGIAITMLYNQFSGEVSEIPATWFGVLNSLYIITLAPLFSKWWGSKYNPSASMKYGLGMTLLALGMAMVAIPSMSIPVGAASAAVSPIWLVLVYLFHTMGELCLSPVALSYVSKLVPGRMIAFMFGVWYLAVAIGMKGAGLFGEASSKIAETDGLSYFFWLLTGIALALAVLAFLLNPVIKKLMHGVR